MAAAAMLGSHDPLPTYVCYSHFERFLEPRSHNFFVPVYIRQQTVNPALQEPDPLARITHVDADTIERRRARIPHNIGKISRKTVNMKRKLPPSRGGGGGGGGGGKRSIKARKQEAPARKKTTKRPVREPVPMSSSSSSSESDASESDSRYSDSDSSDDDRGDVAAVFNDASDNLHDEAHNQLNGDDDVDDDEKRDVIIDGYRVRRLQLGFKGVARGPVGRPMTEEQRERDLKRFDPNNPRHQPSVHVKDRNPTEAEHEAETIKIKREARENNERSKEPAFSILSTKPSDSILGKRNRKDADAAEARRRAVNLFGTDMARTLVGVDEFMHTGDPSIITRISNKVDFMK